MAIALIRYDTYVDISGIGPGLGSGLWIETQIEIQVGRGGAYAVWGAACQCR